VVFIIAVIYASFGPFARVLQITHPERFAQE
jgi:hypothetical protein